jgi:hypothetical protein
MPVTKSRVRAALARYASREKEKAKSGGYRVVTFYSGNDIPVFLLNVFAKNEKTDLSKAERNELKATLAALAAAYRRRQ